MKKNLITLAIVGAAMVPTLATAGVSVYGRAQVEIASIDDGTNSAIDTLDNSMGRIGVSASEDLGGGLTGLAKFEMKADTTDGDVSKCTATVSGAAEAVPGTPATASCKVGVSLTGRESMVGIKGGFGQVELGAVKSEYKYAGGVKYDAFTATTLEARGNGGMSKPSDSKLGHNAFMDNSIAYRGKAGPVKFGITYAPSEDDGLMSFAAKFGGKGFEAFVALVDQGDRTKGTLAEYAATKIGGMYKMKGHKVLFQYETTEDSGTAEPTFMFLGYQGKFGKNTGVFQYGASDNDAGTDTTMITLGAIHKFSKTMRVFGGYRKTEAETGAVTAENSVVTVGLRKDWK